MMSFTFSSIDLSAIKFRFVPSAAITRAEPVGK